MLWAHKFFSPFLHEDFKVYRRQKAKHTKLNFQLKHKREREKVKDFETFQLLYAKHTSILVQRTVCRKCCLSHAQRAESREFTAGIENVNLWYNAPYRSLGASLRWYAKSSHIHRLYLPQDKKDPNKPPPKNPSICKNPKYVFWGLNYLFLIIKIF